MVAHLSRFSLLLVLGALVGLAAGCSSSRPQVLAPEYERGAFSGVSIALLPLSSELMPAAEPTAVEDQSTEDAQAAYFTSEGHKLFYRLFGLELQEVAAAEVFDLGSSFRPDDARFRTKALPLPSGDSLRIPLPGARVQFPNRQADFMLLIDELTFTPRSETTRSGQFGSTDRQESLYITATCQYVLWDNREDRAAAYGRFEGESRMLNPNSRAPYEDLFEKLAVHVIETSPIALTPRFQPTATAP